MVASFTRVRSKTLAPATRSSGSVCSAGLWLMPFTLGTKTMPVGQTLAIIWASWPAPEGMRRTDRPMLAAVEATRSTTSGSKVTGSNRAVDRVVTVTPSASAIRSSSAAKRRSASWRACSSVLRRSTVTTARAATTLTRLGCSRIDPTVPTWSPPSSPAMRRTATATSPAARPASRRRRMGVVPAWLDWPSMVTSVQEMPCTPSTAPTATPSSSSTGPCSMWYSTKAWGAGPGHGIGPR